MVKRKYQGYCYVLCYGHGFDIWERMECGDNRPSTSALKSNSEFVETILNLLAELGFAGYRYELN